MALHRARRFLITAHRWVGLTIGFLLVIVGLSGSVAVVWNELTQLSDARFRIEQPKEAYAPLQTLVDSLHAAHPQRTEAWSIDLPYPENRHSPAWAVYEYPQEKAGVHESPLYVALDPYTGRIMGQFYWGSTAPSWIFNLHTMLQLGAPGEQIVGIVGVAFVLLAISGLYLWWPIGRFSRQQFATIPGARGARFEFQLHKLFGFYSSLVVLVVALTGIIIVWPMGAARAFDAVQPLNAPTIEQYSRPKVTVVAGAQPIPFDAAYQQALALFPGAELRHLFVPSPAGSDAYGVALRPRGAERFDRMYPETRVWVNQYSGEVLKVVDASRFNMGRAIVGYNRYTFHNGSALGTVGRVIVFIVGLLPAFLYYTGIRQWLRVRRRRALATATAVQTA